MSTIYKRKSITFIMTFILIVILLPVNSVKASESVAPKKIAVKNYVLDMTVGSKQLA